MNVQAHSIGDEKVPAAALPEESDSDDDDLLGFVAFPKKKETQSDTIPTSTATTVQEIKVNVSPSTVSPSTVTPHKMSQDCEEDENECIEKNAERRARLGPIPESIKTPSELYWHTHSKKGKTIHDPCRECHPDEALGLDIKKNWDPERKVLVQYIEWCTFSDRALVSRNSLTPYHGWKHRNKKERNEEQHKEKEEGVTASVPASWCTEKLKLLKRQRKKRSWPALEVRTEELYLQRILDHAIKLREQVRKKEEKEKKDAPTSSHASVSQQITQLEKVKTEDDSLASSDEDDSEIKMKKYKSEHLRCGDVIEYYNPIFVHGDESGLTTATILAVNPKENPVLKLSSDDVLPIETLVRRIKIMCRGKLLDNEDKAEFNGIECYRLWKDVKNNGDRTLSIQMKAKRIRDIVVSGQERFKRKVLKSGLGDCSEMMSFK